MAEQSASDPVVRWSVPDTVAEQDCACASETRVSAASSPLPSRDCSEAQPAVASSERVLSPPGEITTRWRITPGLYRAPLPAENELAFNPSAPVGFVVVLNDPASRILDAFARPRPLSSAAARELAMIGFLSPVCDAGIEPRVRQARFLTAWLHVTDACNLRCSYCYLHHSGERMQPETGLAALETVFRSADRHGFRAVKLKYTGGEPTLSFSLVRALHERAQALSADSGLPLQAVVLSNGTLLTDEIVDWLLGEDVRLMISLDGVGAVHDAQRPFADGEGSFAQVARNIDRAIARGLSPHLSITVTPGSAHGLADAVRFALDRGLLFNLNFVRESDRSYYDVEADDARMIAGVRAAFDVIGDILPHYRLIDGLLDRSAFNGRHRYPCGAGRSYLVIGPDGRVARCQMTMDQSVADVWDQDPLESVRAWNAGFQNVAVEEKAGCRDCTWRYWCAGGCPLLTYRACGRSDGPSTYCAVYKTLYPELLRLEGLRLLKWQSPRGQVSQG